MFLRATLFIAIINCYILSTNAAVILQYHHVNNNTPASTSISPFQFEAHLQYLKDNNFKVVPLSDLMNSIKKQQPIADKVVVITFDDAYVDILENAKPLLDKFNYPFTIFVSTDVIEMKVTNFLSWPKLKKMADQGVIIANHGFSHDSLARITHNLTEQQWVKKQTELLLSAEEIIYKNTGQSWHYFSYPYGEYTPAVQQWIIENDFVAFTQQSGAVGLATDISIIPRYPLSSPYDQISSLRDKLYSLPFAISLDSKQAKTIFEYQKLNTLTFNIIVDDFKRSQLNCYVSGIGKQAVTWLSDDTFTITFSDHLPVGRKRCNCTAPSIAESGRYYWYSKPWFILKEGGQWYPL